MTLRINVIREAKKGIPRDTGTLANSLKGYVKESKNSIQISFEKWMNTDFIKIKV